MRSRFAACIFTALSILSALPAAAQKDKKADVSDFAFVTGPKGDRPRVPGLNAVLLLTDGQKEKLVAARRETLGSDALVEAGRRVKQDSNATDADKQVLRKQREEAEGRYANAVASILTAPQKEMVGRLQVLYAQSHEAIAAEYNNRYAEVKADKEAAVRLSQEAAKKLSEDFVRRVTEILTPEQHEAFERAAAEEKRRAEEAAAKKGK